MLAKVTHDKFTESILNGRFFYFESIFKEMCTDLLLHGLSNAFHLHACEERRWQSYQMWDILNAQVFD